jgi:hypothetical protein
MQGVREIIISSQDYGGRALHGESGNSQSNGLTEQVVNSPAMILIEQINKIPPPEIK